MATIRYLGHAAFTVEFDGKTIAVDPFISGNPVCTVSAEDISPSTILLTHAHNDHVGDTVPIAKRTGATVITTVELANYLSSQGLETIGGNFGGTIAFDGGTAKIVPAWHSSTYTDEGGAVVAPGIPAGLVVTIGEGENKRKIYFAGDTCLFLDMQLIGEEELDVAILPVGDHYTMGPDDAVRAAKFVRPKYVIPCHCNTFPLIEQDLGEFSKKVEEQTNASCIVLGPNETWEIP